MEAAPVEIVRVAVAPVPPTKNGLKTTEFWLTAMTQALAALQMFGGWLPASVSWLPAVVAAVSTAGYSISRAISKRPVIVNASK